MPAPRLLIADDQPDILEALKLLLKGEGFDVETATSPRAVLAAVEARDLEPKGSTCCRASRRWKVRRRWS